MKRIDLTGRIIGGLTILGFSHSLNSKAYWIARCECGKEVVCGSSNLLYGKTKSCGCLKFAKGVRTTHGLSESKEFETWLAMKSRCQNPNHKSYLDYGGRGISVCERWRNNFQNFYNDMGPRPIGKSIDRIDNDGDYSPDNCRWATAKEQSLNRRRQRNWINHSVLGFNGTITEIARHFSVPRSSIVHKMKNQGHGLEDSVKHLISSKRKK